MINNKQITFIFLFILFLIKNTQSQVVNVVYYYPPEIDLTPFNLNSFNILVEFYGDTIYTLATLEVRNSKGALLVNRDVELSVKSKDTSILSKQISDFDFQNQREAYEAKLPTTGETSGIIVTQQPGGVYYFYCNTSITVDQLFASNGREYYPPFTVYAILGGSNVTTTSSTIKLPIVNDITFVKTPIFSLINTTVIQELGTTSCDFNVWFSAESIDDNYYHSYELSFPGTNILPALATMISRNSSFVTFKATLTINTLIDSLLVVKNIFTDQSASLKFFPQISCLEPISSNTTDFQILEFGFGKSMALFATDLSTKNASITMGDYSTINLQPISFYSSLWGKFINLKPINTGIKSNQATLSTLVIGQQMSTYNYPNIGIFKNVAAGELNISPIFKPVPTILFAESSDPLFNNNYYIEFSFSLLIQNSIASIDYYIDGQHVFKDREIYGTSYSQYIECPYTANSLTVEFNFVNSTGSSWSATSVGPAIGANIFNYQITSIPSIDSLNNNNIMYGPNISFDGSFGYKPKTLLSLSRFTFLKNIIYSFQDFYFYFPYRFSGNLNVISSSSKISLAQTNPSTFQVLYQDSNYTTTLNSYNYNILVDTFNPLVKIQLDFNDKLDTILFNIQDQLGLNSTSCKASLANIEFNLDTNSFYYGTNINSTNYLFQFKLNRYFCNTPLQLSCCDILNHCIKSSVDIDNDQMIVPTTNRCNKNYQGDPKIVFIDYYFNNHSSVSFMIGVGNLGTANDYSISLILSNSIDNNDNFKTSLNLQPTFDQHSTNENSLGVYFYKATYFLDTITTSTRKYISLNLIDNQSKTSIHLSTNELDFISKSLNANFPTSLIFRNSNYLTPKSIISNILLVNDIASNSINITNTNWSNINNLVVCILGGHMTDLCYPFTLSGLATTKNNVISRLDDNVIRVGYNHIPKVSLLVYIKNICDQFSNCLSFSANDKNMSIVASNLGPTSSSNNQITLSKFTPSQISLDTTSRDRSITFNVDISSSATLSSVILPMLFIKQLVTNDILNCTLKYINVNNNTWSYQGSIQFPLAWGIHGIDEISVWNVYNSNGYFDGLLIPSSKFSIKQVDLSKPSIYQDSLVYQFNTKNLLFSGFNIGLLIKSPAFTPVVFGTTQTNIQVLNNTALSMDLSSYTVIGPFTMSIGGVVYTINEFSNACLKPDCSGFGQCVNGTCQCRPGRSGDDCSIDNTFKCPNDCNQHGFCADMVCNCFKDYKGPSCETYAPDQNIDMKVVTNPTQPTVSFDKFIPVVNNSQSSVNDYTKQTSFDVKISQLDELNLNSQVLNSINLTSLTWTIVDQTDNIVTYQVPLFTNSSCKMIVKIDTTKDARNLNWAGQNLTIPENSIKYTIRIENYPFTSSLNKLQLYWDALPLSNKSCGEMKTLVSNVTWGAPVSTDMHWVVLPMNQLQLYGRFSNYFIADSRIMSSSNEGLEFKEKIQVKVNIPYFRQFVELDPDFSVLVSYDQKSSQHENTDECNINTESNTSKPKKKYVLPLIIVGSVIGATIIGVGVFVILKKNMALRLKFLKFRQSRSNSTKMKNLN